MLRKSSFEVALREAGSEGVLGERGILVVLGCLGAASPRPRRGERRRDVH